MNTEKRTIRELIAFVSLLLEFMGILLYKFAKWDGWKTAFYSYKAFSVPIVEKMIECGKSAVSERLTFVLEKAGVSFLDKIQNFGHRDETTKRENGLPSYRKAKQIEKISG